MAVLTINWRTATKVAVASGVVTPGEESGAKDEQAPAPRAEKPMLVWIQDPAAAEDDAKIEKITLDTDKVRVGCYFFDCIKISAEDAAQDRLLADTGTEFPRMVLITPDYEVVKTLEGKISGAKLFSAMKATAKKSYECNFERSVKDVIKLLGEFDKIANERKVLEEKEARGVNAAEAKKIAKEREDLDEREKKANEERDSLLKPEPKTA